MAIRNKTNGTFEVDVFVHATDNPSGKDLRKRTIAKTRQDAVKAELAIMSYIMSHGELPSDGKSHAPVQARPVRRTLEAAIERAWNHPSEGWKLNRTGEASKRDAVECATILGLDTLCQDVKTASYDTIMDVLFKRGNSSTTVRTKCQNFNRALWFAERLEWIAKRPHWDAPATGKRREFRFSETEEAQALAYFLTIDQFPDYHDAFLMGIDLGMRLGEIEKLQDDWIDLEKGWITIPGEFRKSGKIGIVVVWSQRCLDALDYHMKREKSLVQGKRTLRISQTGMCERFKQLRVHIGRPGDKEVVFHATRHTAVSRMLENGVPVPDVMAQVDHSSFETTRRYLHLLPAKRLEAMRSIMGK